MIVKARIYTQGQPLATGTMFVEDERVTAYESNFIDRGIVEGVTTAEVWLRAKAITPAPVMEWLS